MRLIANKCNNLEYRKFIVVVFKEEPVVRWNKKNCLHQKIYWLKSLALSNFTVIIIIWNVWKYLQNIQKSEVKTKGESFKRWFGDECLERQEWSRHLQGRMQVIKIGMWKMKKRYSFSKVKKVSCCTCNKSIIFFLKNLKINFLGWTTCRTADCIVYRPIKYKVFDYIIIHYCLTMRLNKEIWKIIINSCYGTGRNRIATHVGISV